MHSGRKAYLLTGVSHWAMARACPRILNGWGWGYIDRIANAPRGNNG